MAKRTFPPIGASVPNGWPYKGSGTPAAESVRLDRDLIGERRLRAWIRRARADGGVVRVHGHEYSVAQLTAALKKPREE